MTKKTNSLLFRLGISTLWQNKASNYLKSFNFFRLEKVLKIELIKHKWNILAIHWQEKNCYIQVYNSLKVTKSIKKHIFRYYKKTKNIKKLSEKFSLNSYFVVSIMKKIKKNFAKCYSQSYNFLVSAFFHLFWIKQKLRIIEKIINVYTKKFNWIQINWLLFFSFGLKKIDCNRKTSLLIQKKIVKQKFQKLNGFLYFKVLSIFLETTLFYLTKDYKNIYFNHAWYKAGLNFKNVNKNPFIVQSLFLSCVYNNTQLFSEYISSQLELTKNHKRFLKNVILNVETFWKTRKVSFQGIQLRVSGKLNGRMRKSKYHYGIGKIQLQSLKNSLNYSISISYTRFGIISTKFWLLHEN